MKNIYEIRKNKFGKYFIKNHKYYYLDSFDFGELDALKYYRSYIVYDNIDYIYYKVKFINEDNKEYINIRKTNKIL